MYCRNVQLMPPLFLKLSKIWQQEGTQQIRRFQRPHSSLKTSQQETPSNNYKRFILAETRVIGLHFAAGSTFISFHVIMLQSRALLI